MQGFNQLPVTFLQELWRKFTKEHIFINLAAFPFDSCEMQCLQSTRCGCWGWVSRVPWLRGVMCAVTETLLGLPSFLSTCSLHWREKLGKLVDSFPSFNAPWNLSFCPANWKDAAKGSLGGPSGQGSVIRQEAPHLQEASKSITSEALTPLLLFSHVSDQEI